MARALSARAKRGREVARRKGSFLSGGQNTMVAENDTVLQKSLGG